MKVKGYYVNKDDNGLVVFSIAKVTRKKKIRCGSAYLDDDDNIKRINVAYKPQKGMSVNEKIECFKKWALNNAFRMKSPEIYVKTKVFNKETRKFEKTYIPIENFTKCDFKC